jgi:hypothetical protein
MMRAGELEDQGKTSRLIDYYYTNNKPNYNRRQGIRAFQIC